MLISCELNLQQRKDNRSAQLTQKRKCSLHTHSYTHTHTHTHTQRSCIPHAMIGRKAFSTYGPLGELEDLTASCTNTVCACVCVCAFKKEWENKWESVKLCAVIRISTQYIFGRKSAHNSPACRSSGSSRTGSSLSSAKYWITKPEQIIGIYLAFHSVFVQTSWGRLFNISIFSGVFVAAIWALPASRVDEKKKPHSVTRGEPSNGLEGHTYWLPHTGSG